MAHLLVILMHPLLIHFRLTGSPRLVIWLLFVCWSAYQGWCLLFRIPYYSRSFVLGAYFNFTLWSISLITYISPISQRVHLLYLLWWTHVFHLSHSLSCLLQFHISKYVWSGHLRLSYMHSVAHSFFDLFRPIGCICFSCSPFVLVPFS